VRPNRAKAPQISKVRKQLKPENSFGSGTELALARSSQAPRRRRRMKEEKEK
jgi:hypothetical protein